MTKEEFLDGLRKSLISTGSASLVEDNIRFYSSYINDELEKGRSIDDIMSELGEPRLIANSIKLAGGYEDVFTGLDSGSDEINNTYEDRYEDKYKNDEKNKESSFRMYNLSGKSLILPIVIIVAFLIFIIAVIVAVFSYLAPILLPIIGILALVGLIKGIISNGR